LPNTLSVILVFVWYVFGTLVIKVEDLNFVECGQLLLYPPLSLPELPNLHVKTSNCDVIPFLPYFTIIIINRKYIYIYILF
jgi:hypothetical protein